MPGVSLLWTPHAVSHVEGLSAHPKSQPVPGTGVKSPPQDPSPSHWVTPEAEFSSHGSGCHWAEASHSCSALPIFPAHGIKDVSKWWLKLRGFQVTCNTAVSNLNSTLLISWSKRLLWINCLEKWNNAKVISLIFNFWHEIAVLSGTFLRHFQINSSVWTVFKYYYFFKILCFSQFLTCFLPGIWLLSFQKVCEVSRNVQGNRWGNWTLISQ